MKRVALFLVALVSLIPMGGVFAQSPDEDTELPFYCELDYIVDELTFLAEDVDELQDLTYLIEFFVTTLVDCAEPLFNVLLDELETLLEIDDDPDTPEPLSNFDPNDGVLTEEEAEYALNSAFGGDLETANQYLCEDEQVDQDEFNALGEVTVNSIDCTPIGSTMSCVFDVVTSSIALNQTTTFDIVDGKLCNSSTD